MSKLTLNRLRKRFNHIESNDPRPARAKSFGHSCSLLYEVFGNAYVIDSSCYCYGFTVGGVRDPVSTDAQSRSRNVPKEAHVHARLVG